MRRYLMALTVGLALAAACVPAPPPVTPPPAKPPTVPKPPAPKPPAPPSTTTTTTTTTVPAPAGCAVDASDTGPVEALDVAGDAPGALEEARELSSAGAPVVVTSVTDGRPVFEVVTGAQVVQTAAEVVADTGSDLVAVEPVVVARTATEAAGDTYRSLQWSLDQVPFEQVWTCSRGAGVTIAVVDTGVDATHADLSGKVLPGAVKLALAPLSVGGGGVDPNGHGTHVAGIAAASAGNGIGIVGVAPDATVLPVRALDANGSGYDVDVAAGITWAVDQGADVVNLSLGMPVPSAAVSTAVAYAAANGVPVVAAMGNSGDGGALQWPAVEETTIAVASFSSTGAISSFSTSGAHADVAAPGSSILSTLPGGGYGYKSGTSMATPHVAGLVAIMRSVRPDDTVGQIRDRLCATAVDAGAAGFDNRFGCGIVAPGAAVQ